VGSDRHQLAGAYIAGISLLGAIGILVAALNEASSRSPWLALLAMAIAFVTEAARVTMRGGRMNISLSAAVILATVPVAGPSAGVLAAAAASLGVTLFPHRRPIDRIGFNLGLYVISASGAAAVYTLAAPTHSGSAVAFLAVGLAGLGYFAISWPLLLVVVRLTTGNSMARVWREDLSQLRVPAGVLILVAILLAAAMLRAGAVGAIGAVLLLVALEGPLRAFMAGSAPLSRPGP
jgi:hypothetical protein